MDSGFLATLGPGMTIPTVRVTTLALLWSQLWNPHGTPHSPRGGRRQECRVELQSRIEWPSLRVGDRPLADPIGWNGWM